MAIGHIRMMGFIIRRPVCVYLWLYGEAHDSGVRACERLLSHLRLTAHACVWPTGTTQRKCS